MNPMMNQGMGMGMNMNMNMQPMQQMQQPMFKQIAIGQGIDMKEFQSIVSSATNVYMMKQTPLSTMTANSIKSLLGGEWFVFVSPVGSNDANFALTSLKGGDFMQFSLNTTLYQVCRLA